MDLSRREILGITAIGATGALAVANPTTPKTDFNILQSEVNKRRKYREDNTGATIHLGSVNTVDNTLDGGTVYDINNFDEVNRMLEEGIEPEDIVDHESKDLRHRKGQREAQPITENTDELSLIYLNDGQERDLEKYAEVLQQSFNELEPAVDLNIENKSYELDRDEKRNLHNISSSQNSLHARLEMRDRLSEYGTLPIFLLDQNIFDDADGKEFSTTGTAFIELGDDQEINEHLIVHEASHSILGLPHHYHPSGAMSYNPEADTDSDFHPRTKMIAESLLNGKREFEVRQQVYKEDLNGKEIENPYKIIDIEYIPRILESEQVKEDFFKHFEIYTEEILGYDMDRWSREDYRLTEEDGEYFDIVTYSHEDGGKMTLKVNEFVDKMAFRAS